MSLPFFFSETISAAEQPVLLDEENSRHIVQVLRMKKGEQLRLTNGRGATAIAGLEDPHKKHSTVKIIAVSYIPPPPHRFTIGISLIKNAARFEWFLEKAAELGVTEVVPLLCDRTEKQRTRHDRLVNICRSAMLQSAQSWMTVVQEPGFFRKVVEQFTSDQKMIAHCSQSAQKLPLSGAWNIQSTSRILLIGPEGDFSPEEIQWAERHQYQAVSLGDTRLRTETAGIFAAVVNSEKQAMQG